MVHKTYNQALNSGANQTYVNSHLFGFIETRIKIEFYKLDIPSTRATMDNFFNISVLSLYKEFTMR